MKAPEPDKEAGDVTSHDSVDEGEGVRVINWVTRSDLISGVLLVLSLGVAIAEIVVRYLIEKKTPPHLEPRYANNRPYYLYGQIWLQALVVFAQLEVSGWWLAVVSYRSECLQAQRRGSTICSE